MAIRPPEFNAVAAALASTLRDLPPRIIAIDGRSGVGKTTLGRFLSWHFNSSLIELDLFLSDERLVHRHSEIARIISTRIRLNRPVFIEGLRVLAVLEALSMPHDFLIYVRNPMHPGGFGFGPELDEYEARYQPESRANYVMECEHDG